MRSADDKEARFMEARLVKRKKAFYKDVRLREVDCTWLDYLDRLHAPHPKRTEWGPSENELLHGYDKEKTMTEKIEDINENPITAPVVIRVKTPEEQVNYWRDRWIQTYGKLMWLQTWAKHQGCPDGEVKDRLRRELERLCREDDQ